MDIERYIEKNGLSQAKAAAADRNSHADHAGDA